jgi:hypothetical protein
MDEDSRIKRLREYVQLYLSRIQKVKSNEHRIQFLSEKSAFKFGKSQIDSSEKKSGRKIEKNKFLNDRNKKRNKSISEEIGRNLHTVRTMPYQFDDIFLDVKVETYPVENGIFASVSSEDGKEKYSKIFVTPEEANNWMRTTAMSISKKFTQ